MRSKRSSKRWIITLALALTASAVWADDTGSQQNDAQEQAPYGSIRGLALSGDIGYYTYGMDDVNQRFNHGGDNGISGGLGYGGSIKLGLTDHFALKAGMDYLYASRNSARTVGTTTYDTTVNLPATMLFLGGEVVLLPLPMVNIKLIGGYTLVDIYNGQQRSNDDSHIELGTVVGTGSGFQAGLGAEVFLAHGFSLEGDLAYNYAVINNATFAGSAADPASINSNGTVDYSGLVAKAAFNIYLFH